MQDVSAASATNTQRGQPTVTVHSSLPFPNFIHVSLNKSTVKAVLLYTPDSSTIRQRMLDRLRIFIRPVFRHFQ